MNPLKRVGKMIRAAGTEFVTIPNVPIISTGIEYPLSTGPATFTEDDLRDAVRAAEEDPNVQHPRLKLAYGGPHTDAVINEPAFGTVTNLRLGDNDQTIYGDLTGIPKWLAEVLPVAYPSRSIEGNFNCETVGGTKYRLIINNVSLLGVHLPGVTSLPDLAGYYGAEVPAGTVIDSPIQAAVAVDDIRRQYYTELDAAGPDYAWWWIRAMDLEDTGGYLVVDNDEGDLFKVQFGVDGEEVSFEEPKPVKIVYEDAPKEQMAASVVASMADIREDRMTVYATRADSRPTTATKKGGEVDTVTLAKRLGLPEDATEEQIEARLTALNEAAPDPEPVTDPAPEPEPEPTPEPEPEPEPEPVTEPATDDEGYVRLDKETYESLAATGREAAALVASTKKEHRERVVMEAIKAGKIIPASKPRFLQLFDADPEGTEKLLTAEVDKGGLAAGLVPIIETGNGGGGDGDDVEGLPDDWFGGPNGAIAAAKKRAESTSRVTMAREA